MSKTEEAVAVTEAVDELPKIDLKRIPANKIYAELRNMWIEKHSTKDKRVTNTNLGLFLGVTRQRASTWATGFDNRAPTIEVMMGLCVDLNCELLLKPECVQIRKRGRKPIVIPWL